MKKLFFFLSLSSCILLATNTNAQTVSISQVGGPIPLNDTVFSSMHHFITNNNFTYSPSVLNTEVALKTISGLGTVCKNPKYARFDEEIQKAMVPE